MPLCTHPDLPGQVAELIHPEAHPGWEPVKPASRLRRRRVGVAVKSPRKKDDPAAGVPVKTEE